MPRLKDVADLSFVSLKQASLALRDKPGVSDDTRKRVKQAATELAYVSKERPGRKGSTIGVCIPDLEGEHYGAMAHNILYYASTKGYATVIQATNDNEADEQRAVEMFLRLHVEAVILTSSRIKLGAIERLEKEGVLVIYIGSYVEGSLGSHQSPRFLALLLDHAKSNRIATEYLISLGHKRIAYLAGPRYAASNADKQAGYAAALEANDLTKRIVQLDASTYDYQAGEDGCSELMSLPEGEEPTAIVCYNDEMACGACSHLTARSIPVPTKISIVGNDDMKAARFWNPPLTTNRVPRRKIAEDAVALVSHYQPGAQITRREPIVPDLVTRRSTGPPP